MRKAIVVTINEFGEENYGNALQNAACLTVLRKLGVQADTFALKKSHRDAVRFFQRFLFHKLTMGVFSSDMSYWKYEGKRRLSFWKFKEKYLSNVYYEKPEDDERYDFYCVGSDQVWNPAWYLPVLKRDELFLLTFVPERKKVCMAPSFGVEELPEEWKLWFKEYLSAFPSLSVREDAGAKIIKELTGREAQVVIDPTLMLDADEWMRIAKKPKTISDNRYILTYFLGGMRDEVKEKLDELALSKNLKIYNLFNWSQPDVYAFGPSEFLYLIANAELVMTDSFHACVFSILFERPFYAYNRNGFQGGKSMNSRIDTLLKTLQLERKCEWSGQKNDMWEHDYTSCYKQLAVERDKAMLFLKNSLAEDE